MSALVGGGLVYSTTGCNTMLQSFISDEMRGRVMSLYVMAFSGFAPLGSLAAGAIMNLHSPLSTVGCPQLLARRLAVGHAQRLRSFSRNFATYVLASYRADARRTAV